MLLRYTLAILSETNHRHLDSQSLLCFVEFGAAILRIDLVFQVQVQVVKSIDFKDEIVLIDIQLGLLHALAVLGVDGHCECNWKLLFVFVKLGLFKGALMA